jgi:hypothetical protein
MIWMQHKHIQNFSNWKISARLVRVLIEEEMGGVTYSAQYTTDSKETLERYYQEDAPVFVQRLKSFGDKVLAFRTELQVFRIH